ncbi:MAG: caspase family protein [Bacteroidota bacterium]
MATERGLNFRAKYHQQRLNRPKGTNYLLSIGIDKYAHFDNLKNAVKDAKDFADLLVQKYHFEEPHIIRLYDEDATENEIYQSLEDLVDELTPDDNLIIYYAGHGLNLEKFDEAYWIPSDAQEGKTGDYLENGRLWRRVGKMKARHVFVISDSCFSGALYMPVNNTRAALDERQYKKPSRWLLTSGGHDEKVPDGAPGTNSPFAASLLEVLRENPEDGLRVSKIIDRVTEKTAERSGSTPIGRQLRGDQGGQFVFYLKRDEASDWENAQKTGSLELYEEYLALYPDGPRRTEAMAKVKQLYEEQHWQKVQASGKLEDFLKHQRMYPAGAHQVEATNKIQELKKELANQIELEEIILKEKRKEEDAWLDASRTGTLSSYREFLKQYPTSKFADEGRIRIESIIKREEEERARELENESWAFAEREGSEEAFQLFLNQYPDGEHAFKAKIKLQELADQTGADTSREESAWQYASEQNDFAAYTLFLDEFPDGKYAKEAADRKAAFRSSPRNRRKALPKMEARAWQATRRRNDIPGYEEFLASFPDGRFAQEARQRLNRLNRSGGTRTKQQESASSQARIAFQKPPETKPPKKKRGILPFVFGAVAMFVILLIIGVLSDNEDPIPDDPDPVPNPIGNTEIRQFNGNQLTDFTGQWYGFADNAIPVYFSFDTSPDENNPGTGNSSYTFGTILRERPFSYSINFSSDYRSATLYLVEPGNVAGDSEWTFTLNYIDDHWEGYGTMVNFNGTSSLTMTNFVE